MRTALLTASFLVSLCAPALAKKTAPGQTVEFYNNSSLRADVAVTWTDPAFSPSHRLGTLNLEPGSTGRLSVASDYTVYATSILGRVLAPVVPATRDYGISSGCVRITITFEPPTVAGGPLVTVLSDPVPCESGGGGSGPPRDVGAARWRESVLLAFCSSGLLGLAAVGLLLNRHE